MEHTDKGIQGAINIHVVNTIQCHIVKTIKIQCCVVLGLFQDQVFNYVKYM